MVRKKNDFAPHIPEEKAHTCEVAGCGMEGLYKAPKNRANLRDYHYFCLDHVREHNKKWDYFKGMDSDQIEAFMKDAVTGHRPTWSREQFKGDPQEMLYRAMDDFLVSGARRKTQPNPKLGVKMQRAVTLFEIDYPYTLPVLKKRYKELVKQHHPDRNAGDKLMEEKFKAITTAYKLLEAHVSNNA